MQTQLEILKKTRTALLGSLEILTPAQLNHVPTGFNNNILWNLGHILAAQQGMCYMRSGLPAPVDESIIALYKSGTRPEDPAAPEHIEKIKELLLSTLPALETDFGNRPIANYTTWTTRTGIEIKNMEEALQFMIYHDGLHAGTIAAIRRLVGAV